MSPNSHEVAARSESTAARRAVRAARARGNLLPADSVSVEWTEAMRLSTQTFFLMGPHCTIHCRTLLKRLRTLIGH